MWMDKKQRARFFQTWLWVFWELVERILGNEIGSGDTAKGDQQQQKTIGRKAQEVEHKPGDGKSAFGVLLAQCENAEDDSRKGDQNGQHCHHCAAAKNKCITCSFTIHAEGCTAFGHCSKEDEVNAPQHNDDDGKNERDGSKFGRFFGGLHGMAP